MCGPLSEDKRIIDSPKKFSHSRPPPPDSADVLWIWVFRDFPGKRERSVISMEAHTHTPLVGFFCTFDSQCVYTYIYFSVHFCACLMKVCDFIILYMMCHSFSIKNGCNVSVSWHAIAGKYRKHTNFEFSLKSTNNFIFFSIHITDAKNWRPLPKNSPLQLFLLCNFLIFALFSHICKKVPEKRTKIWIYPSLNIL